MSKNTVIPPSGSNNTGGKHTSISHGDEQIPASGLSNRLLTGFLVSFSSSSLGQAWRLSKGKNEIGRSSKCDIILESTSVSEIHANLKIAENGDNLDYVIQVKSDSAYLNVNGEVVTNQQFLKHNDKITIGHFELLVVTVNPDEHKLSVNPNFVKSDNSNDDNSAKGGFSWEDVKESRTSK